MGAKMPTLRMGTFRDNDRAYFSCSFLASGAKKGKKVYTHDALSHALTLILEPDASKLGE